MPAVDVVPTPRSAGPRRGISVPMPGSALRDLPGQVERLAAAGFTDVWSEEVRRFDAFTPLALAGLASAPVRLGTAIAPLFTRGPAVLAMSAATLAHLAPGRVTLGIGTSSPGVVSAWNGITFADPYKRARDTLRFLRQALAGERVSERFETFSIDGFALDDPPAVPPTLMLAAMGPHMLRLAVREADGVIGGWMGVEDVRRVRDVIGPAPELVLRVFVNVTDDLAGARQLARRLIAGYLTLPAYAAFHHWLGHGEELAPMHRLWAAGDRRGAAEAIPEAIVDDLVAHGSAQACRERIDAFAEAGVTTPIVTFLRPTASGAALLAPRTRRGTR